MWIRNQERDLLINLNTGLRLVILPNSKKEGEDQRYAVIVQTPAEASQPLTRSLPTGFNNTVLLSNASYIACLDLIEQIFIELNGWQVPAELPFNEDQPETCILTYTDSHKKTWTYMCEDEITARDMVHHYVTDHWPKHLGEIPQDKDAAIAAYYECFSTLSWKITPAVFISRIVERGRGR